MLNRAELLELVLALPPEDREFVADQLEQSLPRETAIDPHYAEAWSQEINRRLAAYQQGSTSGREWSEVRSELQAALAARRFGQHQP